MTHQTTPPLLQANVRGGSDFQVGTSYIKINRDWHGSQLVSCWSCISKSL